MRITPQPPVAASTQIAPSSNLCVALCVAKLMSFFKPDKFLSGKSHIFLQGHKFLGRKPRFSSPSRRSPPDHPQFLPPFPRLTVLPRNSTIREIHHTKEVRMMRFTRFGFVAAVLGLATVAAWGQMSIEPPAPAATEPSPAPAALPPVAVPPTTEPASTQPSAQNVLEGLLKDKPTSTVPDVAPTGLSASRTAQPPVTESAPTTPKTNRVREGEFIWNRVGRLEKDEKTGSWFFAFEADGQNMQDPPMTLIPSRLLGAMEGASTEGTQPTRFKVSGEVTEYNGKNYLWVQHMEILRELNKGIGG
jgi:hypothetical protein